MRDCLADKLLPIAFPRLTRQHRSSNIFKKFNKPLPEQFCVKETAPQASEEPSQEPPQAYEDVPETSPRDEPSGHYAQVSPEYAPVPEEQRYPPPPYGVWPRHFEFRSKHFGFEWFY